MRKRVEINKIIEETKCKPLFLIRFRSKAEPIYPWYPSTHKCETNRHKKKQKISLQIPAFMVNQETQIPHSSLPLYIFSLIGPNASLPCLSTQCRSFPFRFHRKVKGVKKRSHWLSNNKIYFLLFDNIFVYIKQLQTFKHLYVKAWECKHQKYRQTLPRLCNFSSFFLSFFSFPERRKSMNSTLTIPNSLFTLDFGGYLLIVPCFLSYYLTGWLFYGICEFTKRHRLYYEVYMFYREWIMFPAMDNWKCICS